MATLESVQQAGISEAYIAEMEQNIIRKRQFCQSSHWIYRFDQRKERLMLVGSAAVFQTLNSTVTMNLATIFKLKGINLYKALPVPVVLTPSGWLIY